MYNMSVIASVVPVLLLAVHTPRSLQPAARSSPAIGRRGAVELLAACTAGMLAPEASDASTNPANSYYFPTAKYRYLPRINRAEESLVNVFPVALQADDWDALSKVFANADDATTALKLYANAVEGSRSSKSKKKSPRQKELYALADSYTAEVGKLGTCIKRHSPEQARKTCQSALTALDQYRELAGITGENGARDVRGARASEHDSALLPRDRRSGPAPCYHCQLTLPPAPLGPLRFGARSASARGAA